VLKPSIIGKEWIFREVNINHIADTLSPYGPVSFDEILSDRFIMWVGRVCDVVPILTIKDSIPYLLIVLEQEYIGVIDDDSNPNSPDLCIVDKPMFGPSDIL